MVNKNDNKTSEKMMFQLYKNNYIHIVYFDVQSLILSSSVCLQIKFFFYCNQVFLKISKLPMNTQKIYVKSLDFINFDYQLNFTYDGDLEPPKDNKLK